MILITLLIFASLQRLFDVKTANGFVINLENRQKQRLHHQPQIYHVSQNKGQPTTSLLGSTADKKSSGRDIIVDESIGAPDYVRDPSDYSVLQDHNRKPITIDRMLATKPLQGDCMTRPGPGGRELTYMSGDAVTRNLNLIFGYNQWSLHIIKSEKSVCIEVDNPRASGSKLWHVSYSAHVRITHLPSGCYREDIGCGDVIDRSLVVADQNAVKASITDAMKRAARHFGDKLGNSLYDSEFNIRNAPKTLREAFDLYDREKNL
jgi:DNA recombination protein Rad52